MKRTALLVGLIVASLWGTSGPVYGWGSATHAYIASQLSEKPGAANLQEIYGALLPDVFNLMLGESFQGHLSALTHDEFMRVVEDAASERDKAVAYGFASHNEAWGADRSAHISSATDPDTGYVTAKGDKLVAALEPQVRLFLIFSGVPNASDVVKDILPTVAHSAIEAAVDLLVCENQDRALAGRLVLAARGRGLSAPILLNKAYAVEFAASAEVTEAMANSLIVEVENEFRQQMGLYGAALAMEDPAGALAQQASALARLLLAVEPGIDIDIPAALMKQILEEATDLVKDDYAAELTATITRVRQELQSHGVTGANP
jgi:hypothetical protein